MAIPATELGCVFVLCLLDSSFFLNPSGIYFSEFRSAGWPNGARSLGVACIATAVTVIIITVIAVTAAITITAVVAAAVRGSG